MSDKPTGVFVRLPLSDEVLAAFNAKLRIEYDVKRDIAHLGGVEDGILSIGTPVTGGELQVVAYDNIASGYLSRVEPVTPSINLVRQSDAQAQIAALEAEVVRLREENEHLHRVAYSGRGSVTQTIHSPTRFMESGTKGAAA